jgi:threonine aldolase
VALATMVDRLADDHAAARRLADGLAALPGVILDPAAVQTNVVVFRLAGGDPACRAWLAAARERGVLCSSLAPGSLRLVTHRHIGPAEVDRALEVFAPIAAARATGPGAAAD